jgi:hypothetical protein
MHDSEDDHGLGRPEPWETGEEDRSLDDCVEVAEWRAKWAPPCPDGNPQELRRPLGFRERNVGELELRVALGGGDYGGCRVIVDERDDEVYVRVLVCGEEERPVHPRDRDYMDCPVRVWLDEPLGGTGQSAQSETESITTLGDDRSSGGGDTIAAAGLGAS